MSLMNRLANCKNPFQGNFKKVLCVCSAGLLRSPTAALVLASEPFNFNTRAVGAVPEFALVPLDKVQLEWADEIVVMESKMADAIVKVTNKPVKCLEIQDNFRYRDPELIRLIKDRYPLAKHWPRQGPEATA